MTHRGLLRVHLYTIIARQILHPRVAGKSHFLINQTFFKLALFWLSYSQESTHACQQMSEMKR